MLYNLNNANPAIRHVEHFNKILAIDTDYIRSNEDASAALPITFTITNQPDVPRNLTFTFDSHAQITAYTIVFTGIDARGEVVTDTFTEAGGLWVGTTAHAYAKITSVKMTARTGTGAADTIDLGIQQKVGLSNGFAAAAAVYKIVHSVAAGNAADLQAGDFTAEPTYGLVDLGGGSGITDGDSFTIYYKTSLASIS
jgi:putative effector of murein hydrolase